ncbi:aminopeptidase P family N-terminal domain-containing protein [Neobacillus niacini]|uniref:aminopeptidase P family N-terminal domain-containing protein n=1 Tax=Neobacillus niacini TaxID=86668 RepID=UPI002FFE101A
MKRGLVLLDPKETSLEDLSGRVNKFQEYLNQQGVTVALIYGDVYHSSDITYLSNICIYWNEGILAVPVKGEPALLSKLSSRVHTWMKKTSTLMDLRSGQNFADLVEKYVIDAEPGTLGLVEMEWWPADIVEQIKDKLPEWKINNIKNVVKQERQIPSDRELTLLKKSSEISARAVNLGMNRSLTNHERAGLAEKEARMSGVEDVFVFSHESTKHADTVEVISEYRGYWSVAARVVSKVQIGWEYQLGQAYKTAEQLLRAGIDIEKLRKAVTEVLKDEDIKWKIDLIHHTDLETHGDYRLTGEEVNPVENGSVVGMRLQINFGDGSTAVMADTFLIKKDSAECLTNVFL